MESNTVELHALFYGKVQGVGFRRKVQKLALQFEITGFVRNLKDGSVELVVQGSSSQIEKLLEQIPKEVGSQNILSFSKKYNPLNQKYSQFEILF